MPTPAVEAYPDPRLQRSPRSPSSAYLSHVAGLTPPRSRVFTVEAGAAANSRSSVSLGVINGPAIFKRFLPSPRQTVDAPVWGWEIGYSAVSVTESSVALTVTKPFTQLMERVTHPYFATDTRVGGYVPVINRDSPSYAGGEPMLIVTLPTFYFVVSMTQVGGVNYASQWLFCEILENVHPDALKYFT